MPVDSQEMLINSPLESFVKQEENTKYLLWMKWTMEYLNLKM